MSDVTSEDQNNHVRRGLVIRPPFPQSIASRAWIHTARHASSISTQLDYAGKFSHTYFRKTLEFSARKSWLVVLTGETKLSDFSEFLAFRILNDKKSWTAVSLKKSPYTAVRVHLQNSCWPVIFKVLAFTFRHSYDCTNLMFWFFAFGLSQKPAIFATIYLSQVVC